MQPLPGQEPDPGTSECEALERCFRWAPNHEYQVTITRFPTRMPHQYMNPMAPNEDNDLDHFVVCESTFYLLYFFRCYQLLAPNLRISLVGSNGKIHDILSFTK